MSIAAELDQFCTLLEEEAERQEHLSMLVRAQGEAAQAHDIEALTARTHAVAALVQETASAQRARIEVLSPIVDALDLPIPRQSLSGLIAAAPEPWQSRMRDSQERLQSAITCARHGARANQRQFRQRLQRVQAALDTVTPRTSENDTAYDARGGAPAAGERGAAFLDQRS